mgnify:CR=1 FL=1
MNLKNEDKTENSNPDNQNIPNILPVLPLRDVVVFPFMLFPALVGRESSLRAAHEAIEGNKYIFLLAQKDPLSDEPSEKDLHTVGTIAKVVQILKLPNNMIKLLVEGFVEAELIKLTNNQKFLQAEIKPRKITEEKTNELDAVIRHASSLFAEYVRANRNIPPEVLVAMENIKEPRRRLYYISANILQTVEIKQKILQLDGLYNQFMEVIRILSGEINILKFEREIDTKVHDTIQKSQRKYFIQEQIKVLQDELEDDEETTPEFAALRSQIEKAKMPKEINTRAMEEFAKLKKTPTMSPEFTVIRNYLDWLIAVPWIEKTKDNLSIAHVEKILNADHFGMEKPKKRILEYLAVLNLVKQMRGQVLCLVGPPGVGKTSLAKSIARALGRKFVRMSLGGIRDEAEIRGHRRTYIGSMPGKIIQAMKRAGVVNPVILMDEVDKMNMDFHGDPASALLEVLDPEQNPTFNDHYLEVDYNLSQVMFITTANVQYEIPLPLLDRMEIIELSSYLEYDKKEIAKRHIIPKLIKEHGLNSKQIKFSESGVLKIIREYTRESGVRNLERELASVCRKVAREIVESKKFKHLHNVDDKLVEKFLGVPKYRTQKTEKKSHIGVVTGLAWTSVGGEILQVEVSHVPGVEKFILTGKLGSVMKESAQAALTYIRSKAQKLKIDPKFFEKREIHIHIPEGAIPKDGPSAGITMTMAMISAIKGLKPKADVAMTGEITLRGNVLAIGGLNEKLIAAKRAGIKTVIIPKENVKDLVEISDKIKEGLKLIPVEMIDDALKIVFENEK